MKKHLSVIFVIVLTILVTSCENNREPVQVLKSKYYFTDTEVSSILSLKCSKCHDGVAPYGKKVNVADYAKVKSVWASTTSDYKGSLMYKAVVKPGGTMVGAEFGGLSDFESLILIKWLETGAEQSK